MIQINGLEIKRHFHMANVDLNEVYFTKPFSEAEKTFINTTMRELYCLCFLPKSNRIKGIKEPGTVKVRFNLDGTDYIFIKDKYNFPVVCFSGENTVYIEGQKELIEKFFEEYKPSDDYIEGYKTGFEVAKDLKLVNLSDITLEEGQDIMDAVEKALEEKEGRKIPTDDESMMDYVMGKEE